MKKLKINWLVVLRNIAFVFAIAVSIMANNQLTDNEKRLKELDNELRISQITTRHSLKARQNHRRVTLPTTIQMAQETQFDNTKSGYEYLGKYKITHYCACTKCCGKNAQGITASGKKVQEGVTIAVDKSKINLGSKVFIEGYGVREAQDTGSAIKGNKIDVYVADHQQALKLGVVYRDVYLVKEV